MGEEPPQQGLSAAEEAYYRAVEDAFARLRGTPFLFSPKDFSLLQRWWKEGVPLAAVLAGLGEVFFRRQEAGEDPVSSLTYCRHAVRRHARRLAEAAVGSPAAPAVDVATALQRLVSELEAVAGRWEAVAELRDGVLALAATVGTLPATAPPAAVEEALARLEAAALESLARCLPEPIQDEVAARVTDALAGVPAGGEIRQRTRRALLLREWRRELGLPRLELLPPDV